jgi:hypothetical protein
MLRYRSMKGRDTVKRGFAPFDKLRTGFEFLRANGSHARLGSFGAGLLDDAEKAAKRSV